MNQNRLLSSFKLKPPTSMHHKWREIIDIVLDKTTQGISNDKESHWIKR